MNVWHWPCRQTIKRQGKSVVLSKNVNTVHISTTSWIEISIEGFLEFWFLFALSNVINQLDIHFILLFTNYFRKYPITHKMNMPIINLKKTAIDHPWTEHHLLKFLSILVFSRDGSSSPDNNQPQGRWGHWFGQVGRWYQIPLTPALDRSPAHIYAQSVS